MSETSAGGDRPPVTVIGLGSMGSALAGAFLAAGHPVTVWNRTPEKAGALVERGAVRAATVAGAVAASPLVVVCVLDYAAVHRLLGPVGGSLAGRTVVNLTNGTPRQARETAALVTGHGAEYLDGGIMAVPPLIGTPHALVLYSGSPGAFEEHRRTLRVLGTAEHLGADPGLAPLHDLALLTGMYGMFAGVLHATALVRSAGVGARDLAPMLASWLKTMVDAELPRLAERVDSGVYGGDVGSPLAMQAAAFDNFLRAGEEQGVRPDLIVPLKALMDRRVADGHGDEDLAGIVELLTARPARPAGRHAS
ncbi:MAG TPA: NAD(P)-binding domain-containing protein [Streptomyces sp.]|uniref:NAD(P)-dependent oxidoreductase n=1 Tax=Streptomyces sp. TaxID=1931 RepID=UPI002D30E57E|nr:NAD(P)-binding domain-containing protein [Streptomyces sp.]HZG06326.1 NAD(P)-binding domain-containing protein [Streptomyces sp.]